MALIILYDGKLSVSKFWLTEMLSANGYQVFEVGIKNYSMKNREKKWRKIILWFQYLKLAKKGIELSKKNDIIISWNFVAGAIAGFYNTYLHHKRRVISLNMIAHKKNVVNTILRKIIYQKVFKDRNFFFSINSKELIPIYSRMFDLKSPNCFILSDPYSPEYPIKEYTSCNSYVFCGGEAERDWETLLKAISILKDKSIKYVFIARKKYFHFKNIPDNVELYFDTSHKFFYDKLKNCSLVVLPLKSSAPAGLIVTIRSALLSIPIIATNTPSMKNYITDNVSGFLIEPKDYQTLSNRITKLFYNEELRVKFTNNLKNHIKDTYSTNKYIEKLNYIINKKKLV